MTARRAIILCDVTGHGGVSIYLTQVWRAASAAGWDVTLVLDDNVGADPVEAHLRDAGVPVKREPIRSRAPEDPIVIACIEDALSGSRPSLVHAVLGSPRSLLTAREYILAIGVPLILTEQYVSADLVIAPSILIRLRSIYDRATAVIFVSEENRRCAADRFGLASARSVVIPNAVEVSTRQAVERVAPSRLLTVARLARQKGIDVLLEAMVMVRSPAALRIVGDGELRADLEARAADLGLTTQRVEFCGWKMDVTADLIEADLFILPSRAEGQPFALLEAMAVGLPVIATEVSGIPEALAQGECGVLVPAEDANALADAINTFLDDPTEGWRRARSARDRVERHFEIGMNGTELMRVWHRAERTASS